MEKPKWLAKFFFSLSDQDRQTFSLQSFLSLCLRLIFFKKKGKKKSSASQHAPLRDWTDHEVHYKHDCSWSQQLPGSHLDKWKAKGEPIEEKCYFLSAVSAKKSSAVHLILADNTGKKIDPCLLAAVYSVTKTRLREVDIPVALDIMLLPFIFCLVTWLPSILRVGVGEGGCWFCIFLLCAIWTATLYRPALKSNPYPTLMWFELDLRCRPPSAHPVVPPLLHIQLYLLSCAPLLHISALATTPACAYKPSADLWH
ncbi:hypothetical protein EK904_003452 [Melospiza melodia maxima]|nr:hypothetical protein EK904_003452 [Melospiza melodia maxima]